MSVTFQPAVLGPVVSHTLRFWCDADEITLGSDTDAAQHTADLHTIDCAECHAYSGVLVTPVHEMDGVNLANGNAADVLSLLGYPSEEMYGQDTAENFLGRVLVALAIEPEDEGRPAVVEGNFISEAPLRGTDRTV